MTKRSTLFAVLLCAAVSPLTCPAFANTPQAVDDEDTQDIIVTAARVRQGGAQDIKHFRDMAIQEVGLPRPESLSVEGLMGEHDLTLPTRRACAQLFCLDTEAMAASLPTRPDDRLFVGLGFATNIDATTWKRAPLNLVAVVDKSGSMSGRPLALVRDSLKQIVGQMGPEDRFSIVLYGDMSHVFLAPTTLKGHREDVLAAIDSIQSAGSTNMEAGLRVGYDTAFADAPGFKGNTRLMLFTDEQPNVGNTDAGSFIGMAKEASRRGIGLTTIGVGVQFDGALATKVSSTRGGNLFFIANPEDVKTTFEKQLDTMVSELAHDVTITMTPADGYKLSGVFGVPADTMEQLSDGAVSITVPTAFLSTQGGGIFASVAKASDRANLPAAALPPDTPLMRVSLSYVDAASGKAGADQMTIMPPRGEASVPLRTAQALVDQYLAMRDATTAFHAKGDPKTAYQLLNGLKARLEGSNLPDLKQERELVSGMLGKAAVFAGYQGEIPKGLQPLRAMGKWEITRVEGFTDLRRGDRLEFTDDRELNTYRTKSGIEDVDESEDFEINEKQVHLVDSKIVLNYRVVGDRLILTHKSFDNNGLIALRRMAEQ